ncbi:MAG: 2 protein, partial [Bacteroidota bacterium]|nr:2 protein [Bacteroidota bacterium]
MKEIYKKYTKRAAEIILKIASSPALAITILLILKILFQIIIIYSGYKWLSSDDYCRTVKAYEWLEKPIIYSGVWLTPHFWLNGTVMYFIKDIFAAATFTNFIFSAFTLIYFFKISDIVFNRRTAIISSVIFCFFP